MYVGTRQGRQRSRRTTGRALSGRHGGRCRRGDVGRRRRRAQPRAAGHARYGLSHLLDDQGGGQHRRDDPDGSRQAQPRCHRRRHPARVRRAQGARGLRRRRAEASRSANQGDGAPSRDAHLGARLRVLECRGAALHGGDRLAEHPLRPRGGAQVPAAIRSGRALGLRHRHRLARSRRREGRRAQHRSLLPRGDLRSAEAWATPASRSSRTWRRGLPR